MASILPRGRFKNCSTLNVSPLILFSCVVNGLTLGLTFFPHDLSSQTTYHHIDTNRDKQTIKKTLTMTGTWIKSVLLLLSYSCSAESSILPVFREKSTVKPPAECTRAISPAYHIEELDSTYNLVVELSNVSRQNLNVNVDFDRSVVEVLGWLENADSSNQDGVKTCIFQEWKVETRTEQPNSVNLHELTMQLKDNFLILSVPKPAIAEDKEEAVKTKISQTEDPLFVPAESEKLRGFARTSTRLKNVTRVSSNTKYVPDVPPSPQKLKMAQDLKAFIKSVPG
jgi:HSP20 family molecular chaperone IbpA